MSHTWTWNFDKLNIHAFWDISVKIDIFVNFYIFKQFNLNGFPKLHMKNNQNYHSYKFW